MDITRDVMRMKGEGWSKAATRAEIDRRYLSFGPPTPTPVPPGP
jgi:hypothetical protein